MSIFDEINRIFRRWSKFFEEFEKEIEREMQEIASMRIRPRRPGAYYYGFEITIGPDGKPIVREFGNIRPTAEKPVIREEIEPLTDVVEEDDKIKVILEMPGLEKEDIKAYVSEDGTKLIVEGRGRDRKYYKEVELPAKVNTSGAKANYRNGVLTVELEKVEKGRKGFKIEIE